MQPRLWHSRAFHAFSTGIPKHHSGSSGDLSQYVSLCAMCSHNEAAVRWNSTQETSQLSYRAFRIRYECYNASGHVLIPEKVSMIV